MNDQRFILSQWSCLGIAWNVPPCRGTPDVEELICRSMPLVPTNPRILVMVASWLLRYWRCVGRDRLKVLAQQTSARDRATMGLMLETVDGWLASAVFRTVYQDLATLAPSEPLLNADRERPALRHLIQVEASAMSRRWGVLCLPFEQKLDAIRPDSWVFEHNPRLRVSSLFKGALKTSLLAALGRPGAKISVTRLARECGVTRKAVYEAMDDLAFSGVMALPSTSISEEPDAVRGT
jgi:hypothetical protein